MSGQNIVLLELLRKAVAREVQRVAYDKAAQAGYLGDKLKTKEAVTEYLDAVQVKSTAGFTYHFEDLTPIDAKHWSLKLLWTCDLHSSGQVDQLVINWTGSSPTQHF